jgi:hypothetical protein
MSEVKVTELNRQHLKESYCDIPWAEQMVAVLYDFPDGVKIVHVISLYHGEMNPLRGTFEELRKTVADLNKRHYSGEQTIQNEKLVHQRP